MIKTKRKFALAFTAIILSITLLSGISSSFAVSGKGLIGSKKAREIALKDAKLKEESVVFVKAKLDVDDGVKVYEIEFYKDNKEYDYEIDAKTGKILSKDFDIENYSIPVKKPKKSASNTVIGKEKAKELALAHAKLKPEQVVFVKVKQDRENGVKVYEIEFHGDQKEYEYEIHAVSGKVLSWSVEHWDEDDDAWDD
ncbi:MAG: PepSY domain-containing protein [Peptostreptococcaceae bacterium]|nr:PepSY domain-containing protein [Peptostreptococcaceae bacterium]